MRTSLVIPCFNEAPGIPQLSCKLRPILSSLNQDGGAELVIVDDGSTDDTVAAIQSVFADLSVVIVRHSRNRGIGAAMRTGFEASKGSEIVTLDSDCTYDPVLIPKLLRALRTGADVVTASPYHPEGNVEGVHRWRLLMSKALSRLYWLILPQKLYTFTSCFRAYRREALPYLESHEDGFLAMSEILVSAILSGLHVREVPATLSQRRFGQSKIRVLQVSLSHLRYIGSIIANRTLGLFEGVHTRPAVVRKARPRS